MSGLRQLIFGLSQKNLVCSGPLSVTVQPLSVTVQPLSVTVQPLSVTVQPLSVTVQPLSVTVQPLSVTVQPLSVTVQPLSVTVQPLSVTVQPLSVTVQPLSVTVQPLSVTVQPLSVTVQPPPRTTTCFCAPPPPSCTPKRDDSAVGGGGGGVCFGSFPKFPNIFQNVSKELLQKRLGECTPPVPTPTSLHRVAVAARPALRRQATGPQPDLPQWLQGFVSVAFHGPPKGTTAKRPSPTTAGSKAEAHYSKASMKTQWYHPIIIQAADGTKLSTCDNKKAAWYLRKGLAVKVRPPPHGPRAEGSGRLSGAGGPGIIDRWSAGALRRCGSPFVASNQCYVSDPIWGNEARDLRLTA